MKDKIMESAGELVQPSEGAAKEFSEKKELFASKLNDIMTNREDVETLVGADGIKMMQDNSRNFMRFMDSVFHKYEPDVLVETVIWVFRSYRSHGFHTSYWPANIDTAIGIMKEEMTDASFNEVIPFFNWLIVNIPIFVKLSDEELGVAGVHTKP